MACELGTWLGGWRTPIHAAHCICWQHTLGHGAYSKQEATVTVPACQLSFQGVHLSAVWVCVDSFPRARDVPPGRDDELLQCGRHFLLHCKGAPSVEPVRALSSSPKDCGHSV